MGRNAQQTDDPNAPQLALFNEAESAAEPVADGLEEVVAPRRRGGKRKPLSADLPRFQVTHELPEHELTCAYAWRKHVIGGETSEQLDIVPMQIRVIKHIRKVYGCRGCEKAPVTADISAQLIEKCHAGPSVVVTLLNAKYFDGLPLQRFKQMLGHHGVETPRLTLVRWIIQGSEHLQPPLNSILDRLLDIPHFHFDEAHVQVPKEPNCDLSNKSCRVQASGQPDRKMVLFNSSSRAEEVQLRLLEIYPGVAAGCRAVGVHGPCAP